MATVGKLVAVLTAQTAGFQSGMKKASGRMQRFSRGAKMAAGIVAKLGAAMVTAAAAGLALIVRKNLAAIDTLGKLARNLGIATDELQGFRLAAEISGLASEKLDKALKKMVKSAFDLQKGLSTQVDAFAALGLTFADIEGKNPAEIFRTIADAAKLTGNSIAATGAIMDIFGTRVGADMVQLLGLGAEGLDAFRAEIEELGLKLSDVDVAQVEAANDAWTRFKAIVSAVGQKLTVELAPFLEAAIVAITEWGKEGEGAGAKVRKAVDFAGKAIAFVLNILERMKLGFQVFGLIAVKFFQFQIKGWILIGEGITFVLDKLGVLPETMERGLEALKKFEETLGTTGENLKKSIDESIESINEGGIGKRLLDKMDEVRKRAKEQAEETVRQAEELVPALVEPAVEEVEKLVEEIKKVAQPAAAAAEPAIEKEERARQFREGSLSTLAFGTAGARDKPASEDIQKKMKENLDKMLELLANPKPVQLAWS